MAKNVVNDVTGILEDILKEDSVYIYDIEFLKEGKSRILRIYIDRDETGIFIDDCDNISRKLSEELDKSNLIETAYSLEVSSPGVERKLSKPWHFEKVTGKKIELNLYAPFEGQKTFIGTLKEYNDKIVIEDEGRIYEFEKSKVSAARLHFFM